MIRRCTEADLPALYAIINDAAQAYKGVIPADRWREPYMPREELAHEIGDGVRFWGEEAGGELIGTWADAGWAIRFYEKNGYRLQSREETARLLKKYWDVPARQAETSVVLANAAWRPEAR